MLNSSAMESDHAFLHLNMTTIFSLHRAGDGFNKNIREEKTGKSRHTFRAYTCNCPRFFDIYMYNIFRKN